MTAVHVTHDDRAYTDVTVRTAHGKETITGTAYHLYWDASAQRWTQARQLRVGDQLQSRDGGRTVIIALRSYPSTMVTYNLTIDTLHTFFVETASIPVLVHNCGTGPDSAANGARLNRYYSQSERYGQAGAKQLESGELRFYGEVSPARTAGEMAGRRVVREWDPETDLTRTWQESVDHSGNVRIVRPQESITGGAKVHYMFDSAGNYTGKF